ncbi:MAG: VOC family protein [Thermoplasmata archaeon]|nr:VOC family protein [Thermoplasmata archaeon]
MTPPASQIELLGFDHVDIKVRDRAKVRRFFVDQLGLNILGDGPTHTFLLMGDQVLGLHDLAPNEWAGGIDHIALRVATWTGLKSRVKRARIEVSGEKERDASRSLFLKGPEGLRIELVFRPDPEVHPHHPRTPSVPDSDQQPGSRFLRRRGPA